MRTARLEHDRALAERTPEHEAHDEFRMLDGLHGIHRREVGRARDAERDDARRGRGIAPIIRIRVVGVDDRGGLSLEAAVYYIKWTNVQEKLQVEEGGLYYNAPLNAAAASGPGADLSITLRPSRAFSVGASLSVNNLEFDKDVVSGEHDVIAYREGNRLNLSPKWTASTFGDYHFALGAGLTGTLSASVSYVSSQYSSNLNAAQTAVVVATGTSRVLGQTSFAVNSGEHWRATLFANNVTNTNPVVEIDPNAQLGVRIRPRTIGLQIDYHK